MPNLVQSKDDWMPNLVP